MARNDGSAATASPIAEKGSRANARFINRRLTSAERKLREAMEEIAEAAEAVSDGENEAYIKITEFNDLRGAIRIARRATSTLQLSWEEYEQARIRS
jgi:hypothetical protein